MKANKVSLLILMAALTGCGGGGSPTTGMPTGATYINGNMGGGNQGGNTPTEPRQVDLTEVVGSLDDAINEIYGYAGGKDPYIATFDSFAIDRYNYDENDQPTNIEETALAQTQDGYIDINSNSKSISVVGEEGLFNKGDPSIDYPSSVKFIRDYNSEKITSLCTKDERFCTNNAIQNPDGSFSAILTEQNTIAADCGIGDDCRTNAFKVTFGSELNDKAGNNRNERQDYTIWQVGKVDADGKFEPTRNGAYANLHIDRKNYDSFYMNGPNMNGEGYDWYEPNKPDNQITFEGRTNAVKISTEKPNEDLTGSAKLVVDFKGRTYDPNSTLTLTFDGWKKIDIENTLNNYNYYNTSVLVDNQNAPNTYATTTIGLTGKQTEKDDYSGTYEYDKATGIYRVENITDDDGIDVDVIGGFDAKATGEKLSISRGQNM